MNNYLNSRSISGIVLIVALLIITPMMFGINDAGHRTVIQYPNGTLTVKFDAGLYTQWFGRTKVYNDVITFDFDKGDPEGATIDQRGIAVRYQDGGMGTVYGIARFKLPSDEKSMLAVHKEFRSNDGVGFKLIKSATEEIMNHTAGLMTSEESYAEKRGTYAEYARDQLNKGKYATIQRELTTTDFGFEFCLGNDLTPDQAKECRDVKKITKMVPVIKMTNNAPEHLESDINNYGITVTGFQMVDWDFEQKTLDQISAKRKANMAIITAKAEAEKAKQDAVTAEQQGLANVMKAKYDKEVEKVQAVVDAEKTKEVAVIKAEQLVDVAEQQKLEQEQKKLAMLEYEEAEKARGRGDAAYKKMVMEADGALVQKLDAMVAMNRQTAEAMANRAVPHTVVYTGASGEAQLGTDGDVKAVIDTQLIKNLQNLAISLNPK